MADGCEKCGETVIVGERTDLPVAQVERIMDTWAGRGEGIAARTGVRLLA